MTNAPEKQRNRRLLAASALMLLLAVGTFRLISSRQQQAIEAGLPIVRHGPPPDLTPAEKAQSIARARELRAAWRPWALKHRAELTHMMNAKPEDQAALAAVWDAVPIVPQEPGFNLVPDGVEPPSSVGFGWVGSEKTITNDHNSGNLSPAVLKVQDQGRNSILTEMRQAFKKQRDFIIAMSLSPRNETHLWVSGRVTQTGRIPPSQKFEMLEKAKVEGRAYTAEDTRTPHRQIEPPYDFLPATTLAN